MLRRHCHQRSPFHTAAGSLRYTPPHHPPSASRSLPPLAASAASLQLCAVITLPGAIIRARHSARAPLALLPHGRRRSAESVINTPVNARKM
ncbi:hypothetical protein B0H14DRAFT_3464698 [Mycena olivaceomarginata]|nr:hypothetical protein B0H14DRAFT_3464698 [Mycena olivaceomarginata]